MQQCGGNASCVDAANSQAKRTAKGDSGMHQWQGWQAIVSGILHSITGMQGYITICGCEIAAHPGQLGSVIMDVADLASGSYINARTLSGTFPHNWAFPALIPSQPSSYIRVEQSLLHHMAGLPCSS